MPFAQLKQQFFNHTDPTNKPTKAKELASLNNEFWDTSKKDRIIATSPTKGKNLKTTSSNTHYGRSELREWDPKINNEAAIRIDQFKGNWIAAREAIFDLGPEGKAILLQWHGDSTRPLAKGQWYYDKATDSFYLNVQVAATYKSKETEFILIKGVKRGQVFDVAFGFSKDTFVAAYNWKAGSRVVKTLAINKDGSYNKDKGLYSKAGMYCQTDITVGYDKMKDGAGKMALLEVYVYHGDEFNIDAIDLDKTAFWRVDEIIKLDSPERTAMPGAGDNGASEGGNDSSDNDNDDDQGDDDDTPTTPTPRPDTTNGGTTPPVISPVGQVEAKPNDGATTPPADGDSDLYSDVPEKFRANLQKLVSQVKTNIANGAKKSAKDNLTKIEDTVDDLDDENGKKLRAWCNSQRDAL